MTGAQVLGVELGSVLPIDPPLTGCLHVLTGGDGGHVADHGSQITAAFDLDVEHSKSVLRVVEGHAFDLARESFGHSRCVDRD
jgi:hypothetical protein